MSKSTPISQLQNIGPAQLQTIPEAEATIQDMAMEFGQPHADGIQRAQQQMVQQPSALTPTAQTTPTCAGLLSQDDIKLFIATAVVYALLSNDALAGFIAKKVPGLSNPLLSLAVRAVLAGVLVAAVNRFM